MDLLTRVERTLEDMVEGVFSRAFRTQLQPIEIAKRLTREVESHRAVSVSVTYVPNLYTAHLAQETYETFQAISGRLLAELEQYLREFAAERNYQAVGPFVVRLVGDVEVKAGDVHITVANDPEATPSAPPVPSQLRSYGQSPDGAPPATSAARHEAAQGSIIATALEIAFGEDAGRRIPLTDGVTIGRGPANTVPLIDPGASRHHAEIVWEDDNWVLRDLGSTNGTLVNGHKITAHALRPGESMTIGQTTFVVR